ncbi:MAG: DUF2061 domain-containing protein [Pseudomonadota bacterium]
MDSAARTIFKALTWQASGLICMTLIGYVTTGSFTAAGSIAIASTAIGFVAYFVHERLWSRISWGRSA